jgi:hypothetical protein
MAVSAVGAAAAMAVTTVGHRYTLSNSLWLASDGAVRPRVPHAVRCRNCHAIPAERDRRYVTLAIS